MHPGDFEDAERCVVAAQVPRMFIAAPETAC
jgi:hypothetical protein